MAPLSAALFLLTTLLGVNAILREVDVCKGETLVFFGHAVLFPVNSSQIPVQASLDGDCNKAPPFDVGYTFTTAINLTSGPEYSSSQIGTILAVGFAIMPGRIVFKGSLTLNGRGSINIQWDREIPYRGQQLYVLQGGTGEFVNVVGNMTSAPLSTYYGGLNAVFMHQVNARMVVSCLA